MLGNEFCQNNKSVKYVFLNSRPAKLYSSCRDRVPPEGRERVPPSPATPSSVSVVGCGNETCQVRKLIKSEYTPYGL